MAKVMPILLEAVPLVGAGVEEEVELLPVTGLAVLPLGWVEEPVVEPEWVEADSVDEAV